MQRLRVLMYGWEFPPYNSGGLGVACFGLSRALSRQKVKITFVLPQKIPVSVDFARIVFAQDYQNTNLSLRDNRKNNQINGFWLHPYITSQEYEKDISQLTQEQYQTQNNNFFPAKSLNEEVWRYALNARNIARQEKFDIIHAHDWLSFPAGIETKKISQKPLIVHVHATEFDRTANQGVNQSVFEIEKEGFEKADGIIAVSHLVKRNLIKHYGVQEQKIKVVYNGIEKEDYVQKPEKSLGIEKLKKNGYKIVLFLGRLTVQKGPDYFIEAAKLALNYNPKIVFLVAGSGDMENQMIEKVAKLGISDKVIFSGFLRGKEWSQAFQEADLFVMPSVSEPFGLVALESMINGTPVLISKQSGVSEVARNALKTDFWDVEEMANKILTTLNSQGMQSVLKKEGAKEAENLSWQKAARQCLAFYNRFVFN